jgi:hypothetical protein
MGFEKTETYMRYTSAERLSVEVPLQSTDELSRQLAIEKYEETHGEVKTQIENSFITSPHLVYSNGVLAREDKTSADNSELLQELNTLFPEVCARYDVLNKCKFISEYNNYRPPYKNRGISCYTFENVSSILKKDFSSAESSILPFYGLKFDTITKKYYIKSFHTDGVLRHIDAILYSTIHDLLPISHTLSVYGFLQDNEGVKDPNIDIYFRASENIMLDWCSLHNISFPYDLQEGLKDKLIGWGCIYNTDTNKISQAKAYCIK